VAETPIEEIVLSRLPVGHTHEDIDGRFGVIWNHCRLDCIYTPQEYRNKLISAFPENKNIDPKYLFFVPNYEEFFEDFIDKKLGGHAKKEKAKLQWRFQKTKQDGFPLGVKVNY
jgi:hypothetical protein